MVLKKELFAVVLAGGVSSRMKKPKPLLKFDAQKLFYEQIASKFLDFGCQKVIFSLNEAVFQQIKKNEQYQNIIFVPNAFPEKGKLFSLQLALEKLPENSQCFLHNVDNPFVEIDVLKAIFNSSRKGKDYFVPVFENRGGHPILLSEKAVLHCKKQDIDANLRTCLRVLKRENIVVNTNCILQNINTPAEYENHFGEKSIQILKILTK